MIMTMVFIFTMAIMVIVGIKFIGLVFGNSMSLPHLLCINDHSLRPDVFFIFYPSLMYQLTFWFSRFSII